jgi:hypothetical protein
MKATLLYRHREQFHDGAVLEVVIWRVPNIVQGSEHYFKYRLFYGNKEKRLIGYDNERGKGDHRHCEDIEKPYIFTTPQQLIDDFLNDVRRYRS